MQRLRQRLRQMQRLRHMLLGIYAEAQAYVTSNICGGSGRGSGRCRGAWMQYVFHNRPYPLPCVPVSMSPPCGLLNRLISLCLHFVQSLYCMSSSYAFILVSVICTARHCSLTVAQPSTRFKILAQLRKKNLRPSGERSNSSL